MNPLLDKEFLKQLDQTRHRTTYARIIALNNNEEPIEKIEGAVTGGSISVDGKSAIRRSCNLTLTSKKMNINNVYWGISSKVSIEIGLENNINNLYNDIIWFPQGIFILTDFKTSHQVNNYVITLNGKDKMCLLNGDVNGTFNAETDLGIEYLKDESGAITEREVPIYEIILEMVHHYAKERFSNIIINDLDPYGLQLMENRNLNTNYYLIYSANEDSDNGGKQLFGIYDQNSEESITCQTIRNIKTIKDIQDYVDNINFYQTVEEDDFNLINSFTNFTPFVFNNQLVYLQLIKYGDSIGYVPTPLVYNGDLIASVGDSVTSILDKIVNMLGDFEYFYNLKGQFIFQKKPAYINSIWNNTIKNPDNLYITPALLAENTSYVFDNSVLITSFQNDPKLSNIKNDFTVWGVKKSSAGTDIPIHARYAIDKKPKYYKSFPLVSILTNEVTRPQTFYTVYDKDELPEEIDLTKLNGIEIKTVDWREIIYQMALDYYRYHHTDTYENDLKNNNNFLKNNVSICSYGETGYEQYYHDIEGFWRLLYLGHDNIAEDINISDYYSDNEDYPLWNKQVILDPASLLFWFDFFDDEGSEIEQFSIKAIGDRSENKKDDNVRAIIYKDTPDIVFVPINHGEEMIAQFQDGYKIYKDVDESIISTLSLSFKQKTAHDVIDTLLYQHSFFNNSITLNSIPIYYLEPNTIISVNDIESNISGFFALDKFTIPLTYNGTMQITAVKVPQRIY